MSPLSCSGMVSESASVHAEGHNLRRSLSGLIHRPPSGNFSHGLLLLHNSKDQAPLQALRTPAVSLIFHCVTNHPLQRVFFFFLFFYLLCANKERIISQTPWGIFTVPSSPKSHKGMSYIIHRGYQPSPPFYSDSSNAALQSAASVFCGVLVLFRFRAKSNCYTGSGGKCNSSRTTERDIKNETPICEKESFYIWNKIIRFFFFVYL